MSGDDTIVALLADRAGVLDVVHEYFAAVDERRWAVWDEILTPEVVIDLTFDQKVGRPEVIAWASRNLADLDATQHVLTNPRVSIAGDHATVHAALVTTHVRTDAQGTRHRLTAGGFYDFDLRRGGTGRWLITRAANRIVWSDGDPSGPAAASDARRARTAEPAGAAT